MRKYYADKIAQPFRNKVIYRNKKNVLYCDENNDYPRLHVAGMPRCIVSRLFGNV